MLQFKLHSKDRLHVIDLRNNLVYSIYVQIVSNLASRVPPTTLFTPLYTHLSPPTIPFVCTYGYIGNQTHGRLVGPINRPSK